MTNTSCGGEAFPTPEALTHTRITWAFLPLAPQVSGVTSGSPLCPWCFGHYLWRGARHNRYYVCVGKCLSTSILWCHVPLAYSIGTIVRHLRTSAHAVDVPNGTVPENSERICATWRVYGTKLHYGCSNGVLHRIYVTLFWKWTSCVEWQRKTRNEQRSHRRKWAASVVARRTTSLETWICAEQCGAIASYSK